MPRFKTNEQIAAEQEAARIAERAEEQRIAAEKKRELDEKFLPIMGKMERRVQSIWREFAKSRELKGNRVERLREGYGFAFFDTDDWRGNTLELTLVSEKVSDLRGLNQWQKKYPRYDLNEFAQAIHDETGVQVRILYHVDEYHDSDEGWIKAWDMVNFVSTPQQRKTRKK
jgi:hypothetical protein